MKRIILAFTILSSSALLFSGCKKEDTPAPSTQGFAALTTNSTFNYRYTEGSNVANYMLTVTNRDTAVNGKTYKVLTSTDGVNRYNARSGDDYYRFGSFPTLGVNNLEELYLKANAGLNDTWTKQVQFNYPGIPTALSANLTYKIVEKGVSRTVSGTNFPNVIHVRLDIKVDFFGDIGGGDFYYAEGVGMIENSINVSSALIPPFTSSEVLTAYQIK